MDLLSSWCSLRWSLKRPHRAGFGSRWGSVTRMSTGCKAGQNLASYPVTSVKEQNISLCSPWRAQKCSIEEVGPRKPQLKDWRSPKCRGEWHYLGQRLGHTGSMPPICKASCHGLRRKAKESLPRHILRSALLGDLACSRHVRRLLASYSRLHPDQALHRPKGARFLPALAVLRLGRATTSYGDG